MTERSLVHRLNDPEALRKLALAYARKADAAKITAERYAKAVHDAIAVALSDLKIPPVPPPRKDQRSRGEEVAVAVLSDWQLAKVTKTYNSKVCAQRIDAFADKVIKLTEIQRRDHPVKTLRVWCLGDLIEGELIFPGQAHLIEPGGLFLQLRRCSRILATFLRRMLSAFDLVHVSVVPGNHGRLGGRQHRDYHPDSNMDRLVAATAQDILDDEPRLTWDIAEGVLEGGWYTVDDIGGFRTLLFHGDQIQGGLTTENHVKKLVLGWKAGAIDGGFQDAFLGHFHVVKKFTFNEVTVRVSGSPESDNAYAVRALGSRSNPSQHLQFVAPGRFVTAEYTVWL